MGERWPACIPPHIDEAVATNASSVRIPILCGINAILLVQRTVSYQSGRSAAARFRHPPPTHSKYPVLDTISLDAATAITRFRPLTSE